MVRRRRSMSQHVDIFKRAPIEESIDPSSAVSSKTEGMELRGTVAPQQGFNLAAVV